MTTRLKSGDAVQPPATFIGRTGIYRTGRGDLLPAVVGDARYTAAGDGLEVDLVVTRPGNSGARPSGPFLEAARGVRVGNPEVVDLHTFAFNR